MNYWTLIKTSLALASIGILLEPTLRRLGYLRPTAAGERLALEAKTGKASTTRARNKAKTASMTTDTTARKNSNGREQRHH